MAVALVLLIIIAVIASIAYYQEHMSLVGTLEEEKLNKGLFDIVLSQHIEAVGGKSAANGFIRAVLATRNTDMISYVIDNATKSVGYDNKISPTSENDIKLLVHMVGKTWEKEFDQ